MNLADFCRDHAAIECHIRLVENERVVGATEADLGIVFGDGAWPGKWSTLLENVAIAPACSPLLFQQAGRTLVHAADLRDVVLLHQDDGSEWQRWLAGEGEHNFELYRRHLYCNDLSFAIDLAAQGVGAVLVSDTLSASHVSEGKLLRPFSGAIQATGGWYVVCDGYRLERSNVRSFLRWLLGHFGKHLPLTSTVQDVDPDAIANP
jgi:LysR family glycine cleavage system transcriptional activator